MPESAGGERCRAGAASLRRTCLHEYAHLAVARHFGASGFVTIRAIVGASGEARYAGRFQMFGELDDSEWRIVALAGALAECVDSQSAITPAAAHARLETEPSLLGGVDAELARGFALDDVALALSLVRSFWASIDADAAELAQSRATR